MCPYRLCLCCSREGSWGLVTAMAELVPVINRALVLKQNSWIIQTWMESDLSVQSSGWWGSNIPIQPWPSQQCRYISVSGDTKNLTQQVPEQPDATGSTLSKTGLGDLQKLFILRFYEWLFLRTNWFCLNYVVVWRFALEVNWNRTPCTHSIKLLLTFRC